MSRLLLRHLRVDGLGTYPAFVEEDRPRRALFTFETASRIRRDWERFPYEDECAAREVYYDPSEDAFYLYDPGSEEWMSWAGERVGRLTCYAVGDTW